MNNKQFMIYIIDDDFSSRKIIEGMLKAEKYSIKSFGNVDHCLEELEMFTPDLFIIDLIMPVKDGFWLIKHLNENPRLKGIPRIVLSGVRDIPMIKKVKELETDYYALKPVDEYLLLDKVEKLLRLKNRDDMECDLSVNVYINGRVDAASDCSVYAHVPFKPYPGEVIEASSDLFSDQVSYNFLLKSDKKSILMEERKNFRVKYDIQGPSSSYLARISKERK